MKVNVKYIPCLFDESTWIQFESHNQTVFAIFQFLFQKYPEVRDDPPYITVRVNGKKIHLLKWAKPLNDGDEVLIIQEIGGEIIVAIGAALGLWGASAAGLFGMSLAMTINVGLLIVTVAYTIYSYCTAPEAAKTGRGLNSSPTYGWEGIQMQVRPGVPVPTVHGEHLLGGNLIEAYISSDADKNYLNMLIALSEGEIEGIMKEDLSGVCTSTSDVPYILINDNLLSNFKDVTWDYRLGTQDQTQIPEFGDVCQTYSMAGVHMTTTPYLYTTVDSDVEAFELRFRVPSLFNSYKGNYYPFTTGVLIEHKLHSAGTWTTDETLTITGSSQQPLRRFFRLDNLTPGQYDIRVTYSNSGWVTSPEHPCDIYLDNITEIKYDTLIYPYTALLAIQVLATEQLSGQLPNVLTRIRGIKVKNLDTSATAWTNNPIYNVNDLMVNPRYGMGKYITQSNVNNDQLILMAQYCDQMLGDGTQRAGDSTTSTSLTDSDYTFVAGDIGKYICCKSVADITVYTVLLITSLSGDHTAIGSGGWTLGTPPAGNWEFGEKRSELDLVIDAPNQAFDCINQICSSFRALPIWSHDAIQLLIDKKESPSYIFNMGNIIEGSFKHSFASEKSKPNCIQVDYADRDKKFQKETVDITDSVTIAGGVPMRTRRMSLLGATRQSQIYREARFHLLAAKYQDEQITFKGAIDAIHLLPGDVDKFQHDVFAWGQGSVRIASATTTSITFEQSITIGANYIITCKLANDTLETRTIHEGAGTYTTITFDVAFTSPGPPAGGIYAIGAVGVEAKPFRVMSILKTPENEIEVVATEYSESVYTDTEIVLAQPVYSALPPNIQFPSGPDVSNPLLVPPDVTNFAVTETTGQTGVSITFTQPAATTNWSRADIYVSIDGGSTYKYINTMHDAGPMVYPDVLAGSTYYFKAISYSPFDVAGPTPPVVHLTITGAAAVGITSLTATAAFRNIFLDWVNVADTNISGTEVWRSDSNNRAAASLIATVYADAYIDQIDAYGVTKYYWLRNKNPNGTYSAWYPVNQYAGVYATTAYIQGTDIENLGVDLSDIFMKIPVVTGDSWSDNYPSAGYVYWNAHTLYYNGAGYSIAADSTNLKYIYWANGCTGYYASATNPTLGDGDFVIAVNISGYHDLAWNAIANEVIGSAYIENGAILNAKIGNLEVDSAKIADLTVGTIKIANYAIGRGVEYYNAAGYTLPYTDTAEHEIGTLTAVTYTTTDSVWLWASMVVTEMAYKAAWKSGAYVPIQFRIRRDSTTGTIITGALTMGQNQIFGQLLDAPPIILVGSDVPGGSAGNHVYKLTAQLTNASDSGADQGIIAFRLMMAMAKSK
jgi:predicted phage tail protein